MMKRTGGMLVLWGTGIAVLACAVGQPAFGVPAFARKYETSCMTCHVAYPKLNAFGEAFRLDGYQIPETETELRKDPGVALGSDGWKRVWPDGVWPGQIPEVPPLAAVAETEFEYERNGPVTTQFGRPSVNLFLAGGMEEDISFYLGFHLFEEGELGSLGRTFIQFSNLLSNRIPRYLLNVRIGQFIPEAVPFANHRGLTLTPYAPNVFSAGTGLATGHVHGGDERFVFESNQAGIEARGVVRSRLRYGVGLVNGSGTTAESNDAKDGYVRLAYKYGGIGFDGSGGGTASLRATSMEDNAITLGSFGYLGALDNGSDAGPQDLKVRRLGVDFSLTRGALNVFGVYALGRDETVHDGGLEEVDLSSWFVETDYGLYPWAIAVLRFETADADGVERQSRFVPNLTLLPRANIRAVIESVVDADDPGFDMLVTRLDYAF